MTRALEEGGGRERRSREKERFKLLTEREEEKEEEPHPLRSDGRVRPGRQVQRGFFEGRNSQSDLATGKNSSNQDP